MAATDTCICCGAPIPEGRQVCPWCENGYTPDKRKDGSNAWTHKRNGQKYT